MAGWNGRQKQPVIFFFKNETAGGNWLDFMQKTGAGPGEKKTLIRRVFTRDGQKKKMAAWGRRPVDSKGARILFLDRNVWKGVDEGWRGAARGAAEKNHCLGGNGPPSGRGRGTIFDVRTWLEICGAVCAATWSIITRGDWWLRARLGEGLRAGNYPEPEGRKRGKRLEQGSSISPFVAAGEGGRPATERGASGHSGGFGGVDVAEPRGGKLPGV